MEVANGVLAAARCATAEHIKEGVAESARFSQTFSKTLEKPHEH